MSDKVISVIIILVLISLAAFMCAEFGRAQTRREQCESACLPNAVIQSTKLYCSCAIETKTIWRKDIK